MSWVLVGGGTAQHRLVVTFRCLGAAHMVCYVFVLQSVLALQASSPLFAHTVSGTALGQGGVVSFGGRVLLRST